MNDAKPMTIAGKIGDKLLRQSKLFFKNDTKTILDEMIQNARRAGATQIIFRQNGHDFEIQDDGKGLAKEHAHVLVTLGGSHNEDAIEEAEMAAGIGFFSLAHYDVHVRSRTWSCWLTPDVFIGNEDAVIEDEPVDAIGTKITIKDYFLHNDAGIYQTIAEAVCYCPLEAYGENIARTNAQDKTKLFSGRFEQMTFMKENPGTIQRFITVPGATIGVNFFENETGLHELRLNFFGKTHTISSAMNFPSMLQPRIAMTQSYVTQDETGQFHIQTGQFVIMVDVTSAAMFKLRLPDRDALVNVDGLRDARDKIEQAMADIISKLPANMIANNDPIRKSYSLPAPTFPLTGPGSWHWIDYVINGDEKHATITDAEGQVIDKSQLIIVPEGERFIPLLGCSFAACGKVYNFVNIKGVKDKTCYEPDAKLFNDMAFIEAFEVRIKLSDGQIYCDGLETDWKHKHDGRLNHDLAAFPENSKATVFDVILKINWGAYPPAADAKETAYKKPDWRNNHQVARFVAAISDAQAAPNQILSADQRQHLMMGGTAKKPHFYSHIVLEGLALYRGTPEYYVHDANEPLATINLLINNKAPADIVSTTLTETISSDLQHVFKEDPDNEDEYEFEDFCQDLYELIDADIDPVIRLIKGDDSLALKRFAEDLKIQVRGSLNNARLPKKAYTAIIEISPEHQVHVEMTAKKRTSTARNLGKQKPAKKRKAAGPTHA